MADNQSNRDLKGQDYRSREFTAKDVQAILRAITGHQEKIGLALLNYYARTGLVQASGKGVSRGRSMYSYPDVVLLCWLFRMKQEGLPVVRFRKGLDYLRKRVNQLDKNPEDMVLVTDGKQLFLLHRHEDKVEIAEALTGRRAGQYVWAYAIGSLIEEVREIIKEIENEGDSSKGAGRKAKARHERSRRTHAQVASEESQDTVGEVMGLAHDSAHDLNVKGRKVA